MSCIMAITTFLPAGVQGATYDIVVSNSGVESNEVYKITAKHSGKVLDVEGGYTHDGANVQQWTDNGNPQQQWKVIDVGGGYYKLIAMHSGKALDVEGGYTHDGANVQQWTDNGSSHQKWKIESTGDGYYKLIAECSQKALDVSGGFTDDGSNVQQWTDNGNEQQKWKFTLVSETGDTQAPSVPGSLKVVSSTNDTITISWKASTDNVDVEGYDIYVGSEFVGTSSETTYTVNNLEADTTYEIYVEAKDAAGNRSAKAHVSGTTKANTIIDTEAPTVPTNLKVTNQTSNAVTVSWKASTDNVGVEGYEVYVDNKFVGNASGTSYRVEGLEADTTYAVSVQAKDAAGNKSEKANINATTLKKTDDPTDTEAPTAPANLKVINKTTNSATITWAESDDNVGVEGYDIYVNNEFVGTTTNTNYKLTGLEADTTYAVSVQAKDAAGNKSAKSNVTVKTNADITLHDGFYIQGTTLYDANGKPFVMRGINHAYTWFQGKEDIAIPAIAKTGANCVRLVLADNQQWEKTSLSELQRLIKLCEQNNLVAIVEVHDVTGFNNVSDLEQVAQYWIEMKSALAGHEKTVILNIANEWCGNWDGATWRDGYKSVIPKLRDAGIKNTIMVDCAGYGQYPQSIFDYGKEVAQCDKLNNTMFSIHMYEYAGGNASQVKSNIDSALNIGVPVCIGEFGIKHKDGDVDEQTIMSYCEQKAVGYLGWSWKGNNEELQYLDMVNDWAGNSLTEQGNAIINGQYGIKATSKICSVFSETNDDKEAPTTPSNLTGTATSYNTIELNWNESSDNVGVEYYNIYQNGELIDITQSNNYTATYLKANKAYSFSVSALDAAGNESAKSSEVTVKTLDSNDKKAPTAPTNLKGTASVTVANLSWDKATDNIGVAGYIIYQDGVKIGVSTKTNFAVSNLTAGETYTFTVAAFDDAGNESVLSDKLVLTTGKADEFPPIEPGLLGEYDDWYVGINGDDKPATPTVAKITRLENGGLEMSFDLRTENYPCFQVDPEVTADWSKYKNMNIIVTNPNAKEIQLQTIVKDGDWEWTEPGQYAKIPAKTTTIITVP